LIYYPDGKNEKTVSVYHGEKSKYARERSVWGGLAYFKVVRGIIWQLSGSEKLVTSSPSIGDGHLVVVAPHSHPRESAMCGESSQL
jgi:hypothetical protein